MLARFNSALLSTLMVLACVGSASAKPPALATNASCKKCHEDAWTQWKRSRHAVAGINPTFKFEYQRRPSNWCLGCHAPRKAAREPRLARRPALKAGVDCLACHVQNGQLVSTDKAETSPHKTRVESDFGTPKMCAACHQFNFPLLDRHGELISYTDQPMQDTGNEFLRSGMAASGAACVGCHMPSGSHEFPGAHDATQVRKALQLTHCKTSSALELTITNRLQAHNLPSGGVNRAIVITVWAAKNPGGARTHRLERLFDGPMGKRVKRKDTTLRAGQSRTWNVLLSYLLLEEITTLHIESQFYFGTDAHPDRPTSKLTIDKERIDWQRIPTCTAPAPEASEP